MSGSNEGMFRRLTRLVGTPGRDAAGAAGRGDTEVRPTEFDKAEMKAMIERKRRNDYVRKRELDMLRRIRREGLSAEQAASLAAQSSRLDDTEARSTQSSMHGSGIKAKIDAIERQMVGATSGVSAGSGSKAARTAPAVPPGPPPPILTTTIYDDEEGDPTVPVGLVSDDEPAQTTGRAARTAPMPLTLDIAADTRTPIDHDGPPNAHDMPATVPAALTAARPQAAAVPGHSIDLGNREWVEVNEVAHDAALDEPVMAFASGDFQACEAALQAMVGPRGDRRDQEETWLVLFDFYRAIGQQAKFESLTMDYVERFHRSAPQWFSLPRMLADATATPRAEDRMGGSIGWVCPKRLDLESVNRLDALSMQLPSPWVMGWSDLETIDVDAAVRLCDMMTGWSSQSIAMRWVGGERLFTVLAEIAPTGVRDADPAYWMLRMEALRLAHRPDQFDEVAIDYCVTYEVSPPSWENARCNAHLVGSAASTRTLSLSVVGDAVTSFQDTTTVAQANAPVRVTSIELAGQLAGDHGELLERLSRQVADAKVVRISCALLMRVDFVAAGDLLNWVSKRHGEGQGIYFLEAHRLVALMFGAIGIADLARVQLRQA